MRHGCLQDNNSELVPDSWLKNVWMVGGLTTVDKMLSVCSKPHFFSLAVYA